MREIRLSCAELDGPDADRYEVIDHKVSLRLARRPGAHVVLKYLRPVVKRKDDGVMATVPAPLGVLDHAQVDVSFVVGMMVDKFVYHLPIYRQHQRLADEGVTVARSTIEQWVKRAIELLYPVVRAIRDRILAGGHIKMDETAIRAGRTKSEKTGRGKVQQGWLWSVLGEDGDIRFGFSGGRGLAEMKKFIGEQFAGTIQTDGYGVYAKYAAKAPQCVHALCWSHTRRAFLKADAESILAARKAESEPIVDRIFQWVSDKIGDPSLFRTSEAGAEQVAAIQTILATCRAHDVDPYTYLVDVLQRINEHPASRVEELTPKLWLERFGANPLRSGLERCQ